MYQRSLVPTKGDSLGITVIVFDALFLGLAAVALGIRLWSRKIQGLGLFLNDYAAVLGWALAAGLVTTSVMIAQVGGGRHLAFVNPSRTPEILKTYIAADIAWAAANTSIKISIVHFYITIFRSNKVFLAVAYAIILLVIVFGVGVVLSAFLICSPIAKFWYHSLPGTCGSLVMFLLALSICNLAIDLTIILLPIPMVWWLHMSTQRKIELTITFTLGLIVCAITTIRVILAAQLKIDDYTYGTAKIGIVTNLEPLLGIIVACLPIFPPALKRIFGHVKNTSSETHNVLSSSVTRSRLKRSKNLTLERFDDSYLLADLENSKVENIITGTGSKSNSVFRSCSQSTGVKIPPELSITIQHDWEVRSEIAEHHDAKL